MVLLSTQAVQGNTGNTYGTGVNTGFILVRKWYLCQHKLYRVILIEHNACATTGQHRAVLGNIFNAYMVHCAKGNTVNEYGTCVNTSCTG